MAILTGHESMIWRKERVYNPPRRGCKNNNNKANEFQPLANIQTVPPYGNFYNISQKPVQHHNQESYNHIQSQPYFNWTSNKNDNTNPNNNNESRNTPLIYNQAIPNAL